MKRRLIDFLKTLEAAVPPPPHCHHAITFAYYGSDQAGWEDRLALQMNDAGKFVCLFLDDVDFELPNEELIAAILAELHRPGDYQAGVALGQYRPA